MSKVFVTGGNGFIGSYVVRHLIRSGHDVRCLLRPSSNTARLKDLEYERVLGDVRDAKAVADGYAGCDAIVHLACLSSWNDIDSPLMTEVVEGGTRNVLAAVREHGGKLVFVSSVSAVNASDEPKVFDETATFQIDDPKLTYARHKVAAEKMCAESGVPVVTVNPAEVYGPDDTALITALNSTPVLVCNGGTSIVHVEDVAAGIVAALEKGRAGERYILGGDNVTLKQLAELTLELYGRKASIVTMPNSVIRAATAAASFARIPLPYNPKVIPYATRYWFVDNSKAKRELGVTFRSARDTLGPTIRWLKEAGHVA